MNLSKEHPEEDPQILKFKLAALNLYDYSKKDAFYFIPVKSLTEHPS